MTPNLNQDQYNALPGYRSSFLKGAFSAEKTPNPQNTRLGVRIGSITHDYIAAGMDWRRVETLSIFNAPPNKSTGKPMGATSLAYQNAYKEAQAAAGGKTLLTREEMTRVERIVTSLLKNPVLAALLPNTQKELSGVAEIPENEYGLPAGSFLKYRPDWYAEPAAGPLFVDLKVLDGLDRAHKTIGLFHYDLSAALYCWAHYFATGKMPTFIWVFADSGESGSVRIVDAAPYFQSPESIGFVKLRASLLWAEAGGGAPLLQRDWGAQIEVLHPSRFAVEDAQLALEKALTLAKL